MWLVEVIEKGSGKVLAYACERSYNVAKAKADEFKLSFANQSVCLEYVS